LGSVAAPTPAAAPLNSLDAVATCVCTSSPTCTSHHDASGRQYSRRDAGYSAASTAAAPTCAMPLLMVAVVMVVD